eukprot:TRINITY_DN55843_c0_g1_i1.p1 TRINITY_DN55843_c0_g1~~TRINITY_DN55843_c0_g1_i1.p1  ORF type:complete len:418 (-),score=40.61 TRINITY_DN55843_c0_g1_i1:8-1237(-)
MALSDCSPRPLNLAHGTATRRSWRAEFDLAQRCEARTCALANPHTWQRVSLPVGSFPELDHLPLCRTLTETSPRRPYHRRKDEVKSTVHWGQRKLFFAELEFLTELLHESQPHVVVYAGAAPGGHLALLCSLFPEASFEAFDPRSFDKALFGVGGPTNLRVHQECFTDAHAKQFSRSEIPVLFVSDIRTADWQQQEENDHDETLLADLQSQGQWVKLMRPRYAMLKFRLPYANGVTEFLDGEIRLPVWGPQTTTECRLIVAGDRIAHTKRYDHCQIGEQLFFFNTVARTSVYTRIGVDAADAQRSDTELLLAGLCRCFDCSREVQIISEFLVARCPQFPRAGLVWAAEIARFSGDVSVSCGRGRDGLLDVMLPPWTAPNRLALSPDTCRKRRLEPADSCTQSAQRRVRQ